MMRPLFLMLFFGFVFGLTSVQAKVIQLASGLQHNCALTSEGKVKCWGSGGILGLGDQVAHGNDGGLMGLRLPYLDFGTTEKVIQIQANGLYSCALFESRRLKCWGNNGNGQLGLGMSRGGNLGAVPNEMGENLPFLSLGTGLKVSQFFLGQRHMCATFTNDKMKCWGFNDSDGELGTGDPQRRGFNPGEMGDALPFVDLGTGVKPMTMAIGQYHTCVVTTEGKVKCFGYNNVGQLGYGDRMSRGSKPEHMGDGLPFVDLGPGARAVMVAAGTSHSCVVLMSNQVKCWGINLQGQLGIEKTVNFIGGAPNEMGEKLESVLLGTTEKVLQIAAQANGNCVLFASGKVKCWGGNGGSLGIGEARDRGSDLNSMGTNLPFVALGKSIKAKMIASGGAHTCALLTFGGLVKCWGTNQFGQLGVSDTNTRGLSLDEMGDELPFVDLGD